MFTTVAVIISMSLYNIISNSLFALGTQFPISENGMPGPKFDAQKGEIRYLNLLRVLRTIAESGFLFSLQ